MNLAQIIRKSRLGCDAILPGNTPSTLWHDDELVELVGEAKDMIDGELRLARKNFDLQLLTTDSAAFTRGGITYTPSTALAPAAGTVRVTLPPDFAEISRILCTSNTHVRFEHAEYNSPYWIEVEQGARQSDGTFIGAGSADEIYHYDIIGERTLALAPPLSSALELGLDYFPVKRPLVYSNAGTVTLTQNSTTVTVAGGTLVQDGVEVPAELVLTGTVSTLASTSIRLDRQYPIVASITDDAHFELEQAWPGLTQSGLKYMVAMVPSGPLPTHRTIAALTSALMLRKVSADLATQYANGVMATFKATIKPATTQRQSQDSRHTDDNSIMAGV